MDGSEFGDVLRTERKAAGFSQALLAEASGIERSTIGRYETGDRAASRATIIALGRAMSPDPAVVDRLLIAAGMIPFHPKGLEQYDSMVQRVWRLLIADKPEPIKRAIRNWLDTGIEKAERFLEERTVEATHDTVEGTKHPVILGCPRCRGPVEERSKGRSYYCPKCDATMRRPIPVGPPTAKWAEENP